ncbi:hypothetical protein IEQ34_020248 [Dendrobium chrysotoxum]|uniref:Uncharacterized protein n=1 Tax=Dendrobium chrysotoxum TaxID=161865 RepID=A0AAV7G0F2_DENCH|nr:hypothetical protein IEQ34_020248 [Dendrobium chrysotoxum]
MFRRCKYLECVERDKACEVWDYLRTLGIQERKVLNVISMCPKVLTLNLNEKLLPVVQCLSTLGTKSAIGISEKQMGKLLLVNPWLINCSIDKKYAEMIDFLSSMGLNGEGAIGKILVKNSWIMGYSAEKRLRPTTDVLKSIGLNMIDIQKVVVNFPKVLCRNVEKILKPNLEFLKQSGFNNEQIRLFVMGYPIILIKNVRHSLQPRIKFLVAEMGREIGEVTDNPEFFRHGLMKSLEPRQRLLKLKKIECSLSEMLECKHKKFLLKFELMALGRRTSRLKIVEVFCLHQEGENESRYSAFTKRVKKVEKPLQNSLSPSPVWRSVRHDVTLLLGSVGCLIQWFVFWFRFKVIWLVLGIILLSAVCSNLLIDPYVIADDGTLDCQALSEVGLARVHFLLD